MLNIEKESPIFSSHDQNNKVAENVIDTFNDENVPLKIRKINLMRALNLPIPEIEIYGKQQIDELKRRIEKRLLEENCPLIIRVACVPDSLSMPFFYIENINEVQNIFKDIVDLLEKNKNIKNILLQEIVRSSLAKDKISGRITLEIERLLPLEQILEIYKGSRSTGILNNVEDSDLNFIRLEKKSGEFMKIKSPISRLSNFKEHEIKDIYHQIKKDESKMELVKEIYAKSLNKNARSIPICFEFSYVNGKFVFTDFD